MAAFGMYIKCVYLYMFSGQVGLKGGEADGYGPWATSGTTEEQGEILHCPVKPQTHKATCDHALSWKLMDLMF